MLTATRRIRRSAVNNVRARCLTRGRPSLHESGRHAGLRQLSRDGPGRRPAGRVRGCSRAGEPAAAADPSAAALVSGPTRRSLSHDSSTASRATRAPILWMTNSARVRLHPPLAEPPGFERLRRFHEVRERQEGLRDDRGLPGHAVPGNEIPRPFGPVNYRTGGVPASANGGQPRWLRCQHDDQIRVDGHGCGDDHLQRRTRREAGPGSRSRSSPAPPPLSRTLAARGCESRSSSSHGGFTSAPDHAPG